MKAFSFPECTVVSRRRCSLLLFLAGLVLAFLPLDLSAQIDSTKKSDLSLDIGITRGRNVNLWPLYKKYKDADRSELQVLWPLFSSRRDRVGHTRSVRLLPFMISDSSTQGIDRRILSFYYPSLLHFHKQYSADGKKSSSFKFMEFAPGISLLSVGHGANGLLLENNFFFFLWYKNDTIRHKTSLTVFPLYYSSTSPRDTVRALFPLFYKRERFGQSHLNVAFLFNHRESSNSRSTNLFPIVWHSEHYYLKDTSRTNVIFPLYWSFKDKDQNNKVLFPLVFSLHNEYRSSFTLFPLYFHSFYPRVNETRTAITPFFWRTKTPWETRNVLFPLVWDRKEYKTNDTLNHLTLFPLYWGLRSNKERHDVLFPIIFSSEDRYKRSVTVFPLFSYTHHFDSSLTRLGVTPFFWHTQTKYDARNVLFPLVWQHKEYFAHDTVTHMLALPFYWGVRGNHENNDVLFPFIYRFRDDTRQSITVFPLFSYTHYYDSSLTRLAITPFFWHTQTKKGSQNYLFPFVFTRKQFLKNDTVTTVNVFPFYWAKRSRLTDSDVLFPIVFSKRTQEKRTLTVLPLFSYTHKYDSSLTRLVITPLFWHSKTKHGTSNVLFPLVWNFKKYTPTDTTTKTFVFPFVWSEKSKKKNNTIVFPFVFSTSDAYKHSLTVFPLFTYGKMRDSSGAHLGVAPFYWHSKTKANEYTTIFPLWWKHKEFYANDTITRKTIFPLYWTLGSRKQHNRIFFPIVYSLKNAKESSITVFPLYYHSSKKDSSLSRTAITPLFWHTETPHEVKNVLFPFVWNKKEYFPHDTISHSAFFPFYFSSRSKDHHSTVVFPLFYSFRDPVSRSTTLLPFFSYTNDADGKFSRLVITPLFWRTKTVEQHYNRVNGEVVITSSDTIIRNRVLPLYFNTRAKDHRSDVLFPVVFASRDKDQRSLTVLPLFSYTHHFDSSLTRLAITPLFWHTQTKTGKSNFLFPLVWARKEYTKDDTVSRVNIFPLYYSMRSKNEKRDILFPIMFSHSDSVNRSMAMFPLFYSAHNDVSGLTRLAITPLFWHTETKTGKSNFLFPLVWARKEYTKHDTISRVNIFPLYYSMRSRNERRDILFPFIFSHTDSVSHSISMLPLFSYTKRKENDFSRLMLTPLFWRTKTNKGERNLLFPLVWNHKIYLSRDTVSNTWIFPLLFSSHSKTHNNKVFFPLVFSLKNENKRSFTIFPLFTTGRTNDNKYRHTMVTPLFGVFRTPKKTNAYLFPIFFYKKTETAKNYSLLFFLFRRTERDNYTRTSFLWPICERVKSPEKKSFRFAPFVWFSRTDSTHMSSIQPFYYSYKTKEKSQFVLGPYLYKRDEIFGKSVSNSLLLRLFYTKRYTNGDFETRFLHLLYANVKVDGKREKSLLPFYHITSDSSGNFSRSYFFGFYTHFRQYKPEIKDFYEEVEIFWFMRLRSNFQKLKSEGKTGFTRKRR